MRRHRFLVFLAAVFAAKLVVVLQLRQHPLLQADLPGVESTAYAALAARAQAGELVLPLYANFVALILAAGGTMASVRIAQILLGTAAVACLFSATRIWFGERAAWVAALLASLTGLFTFYEATILPSALDPFLTAAALAAIATALIGRRTWLAAAAAAVLMLLLNRPMFLNPGLYFYIGNNAASDGTYRPVAGIAAEDPRQQREDARAIAEASAGRKLTGRGVTAYFLDLGRSWISLHPADAAAHFARKLALVFNSGHVAASYSFPFYARDAGTLLGWLFVGPWLLLPLGLTGLTIGLFHERRSDYVIWAAFVPIYAVAIAVFVVTERDRLPLLVPLCAGAGAAADFFVSRARRPATLRRGVRRPAYIAGAFAVLCAFAVLTNVPIPRGDGRGEERARMAEAMIVRDRIDLAEEWTAKALEMHPRPADVHLRVGRRLAVHSRPEAALPHLDRALTLDPGSAEAHYAMGQALLQAKRARDAVPHLRAALKGGVGETFAAYDLARALAAVGDRAGALQTLQALGVPAAGDAAKAAPGAPSDRDHWYALGTLALQLESPSLAAVFFNAAIAAAPRFARAHRDLGVALILMGRHQDAVVPLEQAAALDPADTVTQQYLTRLRQYLRRVR
ncbi:MAG TPA: tetratricopeptide repeat protein [Vicinamibacterales bacterium]|nr:tetratricopeptide repeat protein [Vicinamibacterales bacterium]